MTEKDILNYLKTDVENLPVPDVFQKVLASDDQADEVVVVSGAPKTFRIYRRLAAAVASVILLVGIGFLYRVLSFDDEVYAKISIDINPSLEISVNKDYMVVDIVCINGAAEDIVDIKSQKHRHISAVVASILERAIEQKYIREYSDNDLLVSVAATADDVCDETLRDIVSENIALVTKNLRVNQIFEEYSRDLRQQAEEFDISVAKLKRIKYAYSLNPNGLSEPDFIAYMKNRSVRFIQIYIIANQGD